MNAVIEKVLDKPRVWENSKFPDSCSVIGFFTDGKKFEFNTKTGKADEHIAALRALIDKPGEFECESGEYGFRMKNYPGKPEQGKFGGGGGRPFVPSWSQSEEGERYTQERMDRRTSLMQAMLYIQNEPPDPSGLPRAPNVVLSYAERFYDWLRAVDQKPVQPAPVTQREAVDLEPMRETAQVQTPGVRTINEGPDKCACGAPVGKPHATKCEVN